MNRLGRIRRTETVYACGCSTTRIETLPRTEAEPAACAGHQGRVAAVSVVTEYAREAEEACVAEHRAPEEMAVKIPR